MTDASNTSKNLYAEGERKPWTDQFPSLLQLHITSYGIMHVNMNTFMLFPSSYERYFFSL